MSSPRTSTTARRVRAIALAAAGSCLVALVAAVQAPTATAAGEPDDAASTTPAGWTPKSYDETSVAAREAAETGQRVELESQRGANSTVFINPDGTSTVEITQHDTRVKQDGAFVDIDPSLENDGGVLVPQAIKADVEISDGSGTEPLATVSHGSKSLSLDWSADLPTAQVDGADATFDAGAGRDVRVTATSTGFNVNVVLDKIPAAPPVYRLPIDAEGVRVVPTTGGGFAANDSTGKTVFRIAPPLMSDSSQASFEAGPEHTVPVDARVVDTSDGKQVLELRPDWTWLSDPSRVLPIFVDPDVYVDSLGQQGTYVSSAYPNTAYPTSSMSRVGYSTSYGKTRTYWQPNLLARVGGTVKSASLRLYEYDAHSCTKTPVIIYPIGSYWDASTATWNNRPESLTGSSYRFTTQAFAHGVDGTGGCANNFETIAGNPASNPDALRDLVEAWINYIPDDPFTPANEQVGLPYFGMTLMGSDTDPATYKGFCSYVLNPNGTSCFTANPIRQPVLTITYNTPPTKPFDAQQSPATCYDGDAPRVTSLTPTLTATADDVDVWHRNAGEWVPTDDGQENVRLKFEVWPQRAAEIADPNNQDPNDPDGPVVMTASGYSPYVQRNTASQWTVPAGSLAEGAEYVWRAIADDGADVSPYWSDWTVFRVNTAESPGINCPVQILDPATANEAAAALEGLVEDDPDLYAGYSVTNNGGLELDVVPTAGQSSADAESDATAAALAAFADPAVNLTDEQTIAAADVLDVGVAEHSKAALDAVVEDLSARYEAQDASLPYLVSWGIDPNTNKVDIGVRDPASPEAQSLVTTYGTKITVHEEQDVHDVSTVFDDDSPYSGGIAIESSYGLCTAGPTVKDPSGKRYLLTAGHCTREHSNVAVRNDGVEIGRIHKTVWRKELDAALIERDGPTGPYRNKIYVSNTERRTVGEAATADPKGGQLCRSGRKAPAHECGLVIQTGKTKCITYGGWGPFKFGGRKQCNIVEVKDPDGSTAARPGDSGGPVYTVTRSGKVHLVGITIASNTVENDRQEVTKSGGTMYYTPIRIVLKELGYRHAEVYSLVTG